MTAKKTEPANPDHLDAETFSLDDWVSGIVGTTRSVRLYSRADLLAEIDEVQARIRVTRQIPAEDRGINDESPESLSAHLEVLAEQFEESGRTFRVQGRSFAHREALEKRLKDVDPDVSDEDVFLHQLADQVVEPSGVTVDTLRVLHERAEPQLAMLSAAARSANTEAPTVTLPFSSRSSGGRSGRTT